MGIGKAVERYYLFKFLREADAAAQRRKAEKQWRKFNKKRLIETYGYPYYLRDKTWNRIKNQKKRDSFDSWERRLAAYGFTVHGVDVQTGEQHYGKPLVHTYRFPCENATTEGGYGMTTERLWGLIKAQEGRTLHTVRGLPFTYKTVGERAIQTSRTSAIIHMSDFEKGLAVWPVEGPAALPKAVIGPSYVFAILKALTAEAY